VSAIRRDLRVLCALALTLVMVACVPIPIPSNPVGGWRQNLGDSMPTAIVEGKSTREDVLLALGEPDRRGADDRWFTYESAYGLGGVMLVGLPHPVELASRDTTRYRVVMVRFDPRGVVVEARFAEHVCGDWSLMNDQPFPCVNLLAGAEPVARIDRLDSRATLPTEAGERVHDNFVAAVCRRDDRWITGAAYVTNRAVYFLDRATAGEPVSRLVFRWKVDEIAEIDWGEFDTTAGTEAVRMRHSDGSVVLLAFKQLQLSGSSDPGGFDRTRAVRFIATVRLVKEPASR
jgi:hypothetical protein